MDYKEVERKLKSFRTKPERSMVPYMKQMRDKEPELFAVLYARFLSPEKNSEPTIIYLLSTIGYHYSTPTYHRRKKAAISYLTQEIADTSVT